MKWKTTLFALALSMGSFTSGCSDEIPALEVPEGFTIKVYAEGVENARQMVLGANGTLFVGSRTAGKIYAVRDEDGDQFAERVTLVDGGLEMPSGIALKDGDLYVGDIDRILRYDDIESRLDDPPRPVVLTDELPRGHHSWRYLRFGPDGLLYIPIGVPCNVCEEPGYGQIRRMNVETGEMDVFATGIRNSVGLAFHPETGELWFTDNGRDRMGDDIPSDELNHAPQGGLHFGFPYCHEGSIPDPSFGAGHNCDDYAQPAVKLGAHVAPLGLAFYTGDMFPKAYRRQLFIAEHGSWNRSSKVGYLVKLVEFDEAGRFAGQRSFASGWLQGEENWGRPADVLVMPDGALLVSEDQGGKIFRISYAPADN